MRDAHLPSLLRLGDHFEIVAVYSRSQASAAELARLLPKPVTLYTDYAALLADRAVEALDVVLPIPAVTPYIMQALASGKHLVSEKPIAADLTTARTLLAAYRGRDQQVWMVAENWRYESAFVQAEELIRSGAIGQPLTCHAALFAPVLAGNKYFGSTWRQSGQLPGGYLLDGGVHHTAAMRMLVGEIVEVSATIRQVAPHLPPADTISAHLRFANGAIGSYLASYGLASPWPPHLHMIGEQGAIRLQRGEVELSHNGAIRTIQCAKYDGVENELAAFATAIRSGAPQRNTPEEGYRDLAAVEALLRSAQQGTLEAVETL
jgi:predicted dehydrogenase